MSMWTGIRSHASQITGDDLKTGSGARESVADLQARVDTLVMVNMAMWSLLRDKTGLTEDDLMERVREVDLADGVEDGKVTKNVVKCVSCERVMARRHSKCLYCGAERLDATAFDSV